MQLTPYYFSLSQRYGTRYFARCQLSCASHRSMSTLLFCTTLFMCWCTCSTSVCTSGTALSTFSFPLPHHWIPPPIPPSQFSSTPKSSYLDVTFFSHSGSTAFPALVYIFTSVSYNVFVSPTFIYPGGKSVNPSRFTLSSISYLLLWRKQTNPSPPMLKCWFCFDLRNLQIPVLHPHPSTFHLLWMTMDENASSSGNLSLLGSVQNTHHKEIYLNSKMF